MDETPEPQKSEQTPEIDQAWVDIFARMATDQKFAALVNTSLQHIMDRTLEQTLADLVRDYLIGNTALGEEQRDQIQMEIVPTQFQTHYLVNYVLPGEPLDQPRTVICFWKDEQWNVMPLPGAPLA